MTEDGHEGGGSRKGKEEEEGQESELDYRSVEVGGGCITIWRELEGKWASPYRNSRQSYCHWRAGAGIADGAASNLISGILGRHRPLARLGSRACTGHVIPGGDWARTGQDLDLDLDLDLGACCLLFWGTNSPS